jgi:hypothetical protein
MGGNIPGVGGRGGEKNQENGGHAGGKELPVRGEQFICSLGKNENAAYYKSP